ncbi:unnamed protein product, partial [Allacma fusca]
MSEGGALEIGEDLDESTDDPVIPHNSQKKSIVHQHFTFNEESNKYICKNCKKSFKREPRSSTGNLMKHLKTKHANKLNVTNNDHLALKGPLPVAFSKTSCDKDLLRLLGEFIIMTNQPFSIVEEESFRA